MDYEQNYTTHKMKKTNPTPAEKRYISILSDYGFKVTFGNESDTRFLRKAIQLLIKSDIPIKEVIFEKNEMMALLKDTRSGIFDLTCKDEKGNVYIVEMQLSNFKNFVQRGKFYAFHRMNKMVQKGDYKFNDLSPIYIISFLAGKAFKTKEFHQIGTLRNQHDELIDDQITYIYVELNKWNKTFEELENDLDKLLYVMKFTETAKAEEQLPDELLESARWIKAMMKELDKRNLTIDQRIALEMALAKEGSYLAEQEEIRREQAEIRREQAEEMAKKEKEIRQLKEEGKKRLAFERRKTKQKIAEAKAQVKQKLIEEKRLAEEKLVKEKRLAEEKLAKEKRLAEEKLVKEKKLAEQQLNATAINLLKLNIMPHEQIAQIVGLPLTKITKIADDLIKSKK